MNRRDFLGVAAATGVGFAADMTRLNILSSPALAAEMKKQQKRVILLWLAGGASQLETWDPKPGAPTGGPLPATPTAPPPGPPLEGTPEMCAPGDSTRALRALGSKKTEPTRRRPADYSEA